MIVYVLYILTGVVPLAKSTIDCNLIRFTPSSGTTSSRPTFARRYTVGRDTLSRFAASVYVMRRQSSSALAVLQSVPFNTASTFANTEGLAVASLSKRSFAFIFQFLSDSSAGATLALRTRGVSVDFHRLSPQTTYKI